MFSFFYTKDVSILTPMIWFWSKVW